MLMLVTFNILISFIGGSYGWIFENTSGHGSVDTKLELERALLTSPIDKRQSLLRMMPVIIISYVKQMSLFYFRMSGYIRCMTLVR